VLMLKIANYLSGAVRIRIYGAIPEKFINLCLARGILLWGVSKENDAILAYLRLTDFFRVRPLVRMSQTRLEVAGFYGCPFTLKRIRRRKMLIAGAVLFLILLHMLTSFVWFVDVSGQKYLSADEIKNIARQKGLRPGVSKDGVNIRTVENGILFSLPEVAWVGISLTGTRAMIEVVEKTLPKPEDKSPADIVATKDGVITEIIAIAGQPLVNKGDTVKKGDVLIKGQVQTTPAEPALSDEPAPPAPPVQLIRANGIVKARVWYEGYGEAGLVQEIHQRTGRRAIGVSLRVKEHQFVLKPVSARPFDCFETEVIHKKTSGWRNSDFTVEFTIDIFYEVAASTQKVTTEDARNMAKAKALKTVQDLIPESAQVLVHGCEVLPTADPGIVRVRVVVETIEDIGQTINITE